MSNGKHGRGCAVVTNLLRESPNSTTAQMLLSQREAARACSVCEKTLYLAVRRGELRVVRIGRAVRYDPADLRAWIDGMKGGAR